MRIIKKIIRDIWGFSRSISEKHVPAYAAQAAYFIILSFIPFILLLMTSIRYTQFESRRSGWSNYAGDSG